MQPAAVFPRFPGTGAVLRRPWKEDRMKLYESYVAEAKARRRRRLATGIVGAVMLATVALSALLVLDPSPDARSPLTAAAPAGVPR